MTRKDSTLGLLASTVVRREGNVWTVIDTQCIIAPRTQHNQKSQGSKNNNKRQNNKERERGIGIFDIYLFIIQRYKKQNKQNKSKSNTKTKGTLLE